MSEDITLLHNSLQEALTTASALKAENERKDAEIARLTSHIADINEALLPEIADNIGPLKAIATLRAEIARLTTERDSLRQQLADAKADFDNAILFIKKLKRYYACVLDEGDGDRCAIAFDGHIPVVLHDPKYEAMEAFEDFEKWLKTFSDESIAAIDALRAAREKEA